jgi:Presenilin
MTSDTYLFFSFSWRWICVRSLTVLCTMILSALAVVYIATPESTAQAEAALARTYYAVQSNPDTDSTSVQLGNSLVNAMIYVTVIGTITCVIVLLYKYNCIKFLIGFMIVSMGMLLGYLAGVMFQVAMDRYTLYVDKLTFYLFMYNFAIVGVIAIFSTNSNIVAPMYITQIYLILVSVIVAWQLSHFDPWTAWVSLILLALYDLFAVLTPCGPLKALVNLMQRDNAPQMPGLLYEASISNTATGANNTNPQRRQRQRRNNPNPQQPHRLQQQRQPQTTTVATTTTTTTNDAIPIPPNAITVPNDNSNNVTASIPSSTTSIILSEIPHLTPEISNRITGTNGAATVATAAETKVEEEFSTSMVPNNGSNSAGAITVIPGRDTINDDAVVPEMTTSTITAMTTPDSVGYDVDTGESLIVLGNSDNIDGPTTQSQPPQEAVLPLIRNTGYIPFALAKLYKLPMRFNAQSTFVPYPYNSHSNNNNNDTTTTTTDEETSNTVLTYTSTQLRELVEVIFPSTGGAIFPTITLDSSPTIDLFRETQHRDRNEIRYTVIDAQGIHKRVLFVNHEGRVFQDIRDEDDENNDDGKKLRDSIKLGLGDFIFYSILVSKAALYGYTTFVVCTLAVLSGLGMTLLLLAMYGRALPALPISILLGVVFYLFTRYVLEPWVEAIFLARVYV